MIGGLIIVGKLLRKGFGGSVAGPRAQFRKCFLDAFNTVGEFSDAGCNGLEMVLEV